MSCHRIDLAIHDGMLAVITLTLGQSLEADEALLLREDTLDRLDRAAGRPAAVLIDLRGVFEIDALALEVINGLEQRTRRYVNVVDVCHVVRQTPELEAIVQSKLTEGERPSPMFETCSEAIGYLTGAENDFETSVA